MPCRVCAHAGEPTRHVAREMMFGWRDEFVYEQCPACECLQIAQVPADLERFYPDAYCAFDEPGRPDRLPAWCGTMLTGPALPLLAVLTHLGAADREAYLARRVAAFYFGGLGLDNGARILDVGCGQGGLLRALASIGYTRLAGVDRFARLPLRADGPPVHQGTLADLERRAEWDLIMLHHSFEHMEDPIGTLREVAARLAPGGTCLLRIPVVPNACFTQYGVDWVGLDAPRHIFLHSRKSMACAAQAAGLGVARVVYDSTNFQFVASEQYARGQPLNDPASLDPWAWALPAGRADGGGARMNLAQLVLLERRARALDAAGAGDQAAFYLRHAQPA